MTTTYLILKDQYNNIKTDVSKWERSIGDQLNHEGTPFIVVFASTDKNVRNKAWNLIVAEINIEIRKANAITRRENKVADQAFLAILLNAAKSSGIEMEDAIPALRQLYKF